jgi:hypothetical protein
MGMENEARIQAGGRMRKTMKRLRDELWQREQGVSPRAITRREQRRLDREVAKIVKVESEANAARRAAEQRAAAAEQFTEAMSRMESELRQLRREVELLRSQLEAPRRRFAPSAFPNRLGS